ncbi:MAG TPA: hypothetical protein VGQ93_17860 [Lysobacter sp.]|jgi:hypothetical protein|nr:hypothetical protein [Lysobacter sp.]
MRRRYVDARERERAESWAALSLNQPAGTSRAVGVLQVTCAMHAAKVREKLPDSISRSLKMNLELVASCDALKKSKGSEGSEVIRHN